MSFSAYIATRIVPAPGKSIRTPSAPRTLLACFAIYSMALPIALLDAWTGVYQTVYFSAFGLPRVPRFEHVIVDRGRLKGLNFGQRVNCMYCDYANGVLEWVRAVAAVTEAYSCAIKHPSGKRTPGEDGYYDPSSFQ